MTQATDSVPGHPLNSLAAGWSDTRSGNAQNLIRQLGDQLHCSYELQPPTVNAVRFSLDLSEVYLNGVGEHQRCLLVGGESEATTAALQEFWRKSGSTTLGIVFVLCASTAAWEQARRVLPAGCALILHRDQVASLLRQPEPLQILREFLRRQISRRRLSPYNIGLPATGSSFFGRVHELAQLRDNHSTGYAILGPGRIGKTSLLKRYRWLLRCMRDPRTDRVFEIDFYALTDTTPDAIAQHIAVTIQDSSRSRTLQAAKLVQFLRSQSGELGGLLELLLDETDEVCTSDAFRYLGQAAKEGHVRLILAGKKRLYDYATRPDSTLAGRLKPLRLEPLSVYDAQELVRRPLSDLGITLGNQGVEVLAWVLHQSGRLPHLIQYYCQGLVEMTVQQCVNEITPAMLRTLEKQGEFAQYFLAPLYELKDTPAWSLSLALLRQPRPRFVLPDLLQAAKSVSLPQDPERVRQVCDELVIHNILSWDGNAYRLASQALKHFAEQAGLL